MKLKDLNLFYQEMQTLNVRVVKKYTDEDGEMDTLTLSHYNQQNTTYDRDTEWMRERALTVILTGNQQQIQSNVNRLEFIREKLERFRDFIDYSYSEVLENKLNETRFLEDIDLFYLKLSERFTGTFTLSITKNHVVRTGGARPPFGSIFKDRREFFADLTDVSSIKLGHVQYLLFQIKTFVGITPQLYGGDPENRQQESISLKDRDKARPLSWNRDHRGIHKFYIALLEHNLVDKSTVEEELKAVLLGGNKVERPILWLSSVRLLAYLFDTIPW